MGRSRRRDRRAGIAPGATPGRGARPGPAAGERGGGRGRRREGALDRLESPRRTLALTLGGAVLIAVLVLVGTVLLAGALGPWIVLVASAAAAYLLHSWAATRLAGAHLTDDDRALRLLATGLLIMSVAFALIAAVILTVA